MLERLFLQILNMSYIGSVVILFVLAARLFLKKAPTIFSYCLWAVALFRLLLPISFESMLSFIPVNPEPISYDILYTRASQVNTGIINVDYFTNSSLPAVTIYESVNPMKIWINIGETLWMIGVLVLLIYSLVDLLRLKRKLKNAVYDRDNIYLLNGVDTPFVLGIIRPKIYLPMLLSESEKGYILLHEQIHIRRFDHVFRIIGYLALCIHWFNPLVWIAYFESGKDMEMSCDEAVIRKLGVGVKKEYSSSLLSLTTGRRTLKANPLAFGEGDTKNRIKNVMNYKKPVFWVIIIAVIGIAVLSFGLLSNPKNEILTIEDYANRYVEQVIENYEKAEYQNFKVVEYKITSLNKLAMFYDLMNYPIELWSIEYRLKPDNIQNVVLAGGMNEVDGWITEDSSMGKPVMVFSYKDGKPEFLGIIWNGEMGDLLSSQEIALRQFLELSGYLPQEFFTGQHVIAKFKLSTGETAQALLSQPATKGSRGIWCVERWMDGNGTVYYNDPQVDNSLADYYTELQKQCDNGHHPWLLEPLDVALDFIHGTLGQPSDEMIELIYNVSVDDFLQTPISTYIGFISNFAVSHPDLFHFDPIEWITLEDTKRIEELDIKAYDMPNGYYIYNPREDNLAFLVNEKTEYNFIDWGNNSVGMDEVRFYSTKDKDEFIRYLNIYSDNAAKVPFRIETKDGYVLSITEMSAN
ncbi:MAG: hypothetical protein GX201_12190 [Clostridiales bacterium]|nr:hypothetical protein [Clostridiales bacterium]